MTKLRLVKDLRELNLLLLIVIKNNLFANNVKKRKLKYKMRFVHSARLIIFVWNKMIRKMNILKLKNRIFSKIMKIKVINSIKIYM
jgi:hypothetical protein